MPQNTTEQTSQAAAQNAAQDVQSAGRNLRTAAQSAAQQASQTVAERASQVAEQAQRWNAARRKPIDTRMHGMLDYTLSPTLLLAPNVFGFPTSGAASVVPRAYGGASMVYSALTRYELGIQPVIPMRTHLILDAVSSLFMAVSPWVMGFGRRGRPRTWVPHLAFAATEMTIVALSDDRSTR